jgi:hypothetical protein
MSGGKIQRIIHPKDVNGVEVINATSPVDAFVDLTQNEDYAVQVNYGPGGVGNLELAGSIDGVNYAPIASSTQAMDILGGTHVWNVSDSHFKWLKVVVPGIATGVTIFFAGERDWS